MKCYHRSRLTPVQRNRSSMRAPMQQHQTPATGNAYKTHVKQWWWFSRVAWHRLTRQSSRPNPSRQDPLSQGNRALTHQWEPKISHAFGPEARRFCLLFCYGFTYHNLFFRDFFCSFCVSELVFFYFVKLWFRLGPNICLRNKPARQQN